jgi:chitinase
VIQVMDDRRWDRRSVITLGIALGVTAVSPPAHAFVDHIKELTTMSLPSKVAAVYWTRWNGSIRLTQVPVSYNTLILFAATKGGTEGTVVWGQDVAADIKTCRARGQKIIMSCGGAGQGINFASRTESTRFVDSIVRINTELGGTVTAPVLDGVDFNTFEANATPNATEYLWIAYELRRRFGSGFGIISPPAPWSDRDKQFCRAMLSGGAMDYAAPQYYDGPGLSDPNYIVDNVNQWIRDVAGGDASKIVVGFGMADAANYSTIDEIKSAWNRIESAHPNIRGAFLWQHKTDSDRGWAFANQVIPLIGTVSEPVPPVVPPPVVEGDKVTIGTASYPLAGTDIARQADALVVYTSKTGTVTTTNQWGAEAPVVGGKVQSVADRQTTSGPGVAIPKDGYVLSGHGKAREWLLAEAQVGDAVTGNVPKPVEPVSPYYAPDGCSLDVLREKHNALVKKLGL